MSYVSHTTDVLKDRNKIIQHAQTEDDQHVTWVTNLSLANSLGMGKF